MNTQLIIPESQIKELTYRKLLLIKTLCLNKVLCVDLKNLIINYLNSYITPSDIGLFISKLGIEHNHLKIWRSNCYKILSLNHNQSSKEVKSSQFDNLFIKLSDPLDS